MNAVMPTRQLLTLARRGSLLFGLLAAGPAAGQVEMVADPYEAAMGEARRAATAPELAAAIRKLQALAPAYPQDVELPLRLGSLLFRASRFAESQAAYRIALSRSSAGGDAELGLAWALVRMGQCAEARHHFQAVLATGGKAPDSDTALAACQSGAAVAPPRLWIQPQVTGSAYIYENHPYIKYGLAPLVRLDALVLGRYYAALTYRYSRFVPSTTTISPWNQHDVFADLGVTSRSFGFTLHYAMIADGSGVVGTTHHAGVTGRYSGKLDAFVHLSASFFSDTPVLRGEVDLRVPLYAGLSVRPAVAVQATRSQTLGNTSLTVAYDHRRFSVWAGGKVGDEKRAAYLQVPYVYIGPQHIPYGGWAGAVIRPGSRFALSLSYTLDRLLNTDVTPIQDSRVHSANLSLSREF